MLHNFRVWVLHTHCSLQVRLLCNPLQGAQPNMGDAQVAEQTAYSQAGFHCHARRRRLEH